MTDIYAVWPYTHFPYVLVSKIDSDPARPRPAHLSSVHVYVPAYQGWVKPMTVLVGAAGEEFNAEIERMREEYRVAKLELANKHKDLMSRKFDDFGVRHPNLNIKDA